MTLRLPPRLARWSAELECAARLCDLDLATLAAIMDRESWGGDVLSPKGPAGKGDHGHGHGLMQIDDRFHHTFIAALGPDGRPLWTSPAFNILYGARVLRRNLDAFKNDYPAAIAAYNASQGRVRKALESVGSRSSGDRERLRALDSVTTGKNYVSNVLSRRDAYLSPPS